MPHRGGFGRHRGIPMSLGTGGGSDGSILGLFLLFGLIAVAILFISKRRNVREVQRFHPEREQQPSSTSSRPWRPRNVMENAPNCPVTILHMERRLEYQIPRGTTTQELVELAFPEAVDEHRRVRVLYSGRMLQPSETIPLSPGTPIVLHVSIGDRGTENNAASWTNGLPISNTPMDGGFIIFSVWGFVIIFGFYHMIKNPQYFSVFTSIAFCCITFAFILAFQDRIKQWVIWPIRGTPPEPNQSNRYR